MSSFSPHVATVAGSRRENLSKNIVLGECPFSPQIWGQPGDQFCRRRLLCKHQESDKASPVQGDNLFFTSARSRRTKVMSKQIFEEAVLSCVDCGAGTPSSCIRTWVRPWLGCQTLHRPQNPLQGLRVPKAAFPYSNSAFLERQKAEVRKMK